MTDREQKIATAGLAALQEGTHHDDAGAMTTLTIIQLAQTTPLGKSLRRMIVRRMREMEGTRESPGQDAMETDQLADRATTEPDVSHAGIAHTVHQPPVDQRAARTPGRAGQPAAQVQQEGIEYFIKVCELKTTTDLLGYVGHATYEAELADMIKKRFPEKEATGEPGPEGSTEKDA